MSLTNYIHHISKPKVCLDSTQENENSLNNTFLLNEMKENMILFNANAQKLITKVDRVI